MKLSDFILPPWYSNAVVRHITFGIFIGFTLSITSTSISSYWRSRRRQNLLQEQHESQPIHLRSNEVVYGVTGLIGNTPLVRIDSLSDALGVEILGKAEFLNPGGSVKDRVALRIIEDAERQGLLHPHTESRIFEGTVGSTGISIATIARARGYDTTIIMPDDVAQEKVNALQALGADVKRVRPASIVDKKQYVNIARRAAIEFGRSDIVKGLEDAHKNHELHTGSASVVVTSTSSHVNAEGTIDDPLDEDLLKKPRGFFADQFENRSNFEAHYDGTGPEIWRQTNSHVDAFVSGAGTGGTIAGIGRFLKSMDEEVQVVLADPEGSGLYNKVKHGVMYDRREAEGTKRRHQVDTVVEGIGINRMTNNIDLGIPIIDDAFRITDVEAVAMSRYLVQNDGLFLGSSSACNLVACIKFVKQRGWRDGQTLVTILCDSGNRHYSKVSAWYPRRQNIP
ncbi:tryptophan synthase beta subunit-like PLP-dependent enzyme [Suillus bovinus]|uniref:tryptophan synthase beta subunit-like PLP-dependent enzyme n=1 Tax=Suillus bovinus TaxID=48563 RepID=UPI001B870FD0|nr:tryptophan synthase beta subunit-like PLP-dependent enzyme [Suillus bovinus]KAG2148687.1 tryptophan synthase beta subunit-like PLP-dependent enzyme [Suillus bovinus]